MPAWGAEITLYLLASFNPFYPNDVCANRADQLIKKNQVL